MDYKVKTAKSFEKELKRQGKRYASIIDDYANPHLGTDLGGGLCKICMAIKRTDWQANSPSSSPSPAS